MSKIVDLSGKVIGGQQDSRMTQSQAAAVLVSELEIAIANWNKRAVQGMGGIEHNAHTFSLQLIQNEYKPEVQKETGHFGYAELIIFHNFEGKQEKIYNNGLSFKKENELKNTNGYFPKMVIDCMAMLLASGLMYNLALKEIDVYQEDKKPRTRKVNKPGVGDK